MKQVIIIVCLIKEWKKIYIKNIMVLSIYLEFNSYSIKIKLIKHCTWVVA